MATLKLQTGKSCWRFCWLFIGSNLASWRMEFDLAASRVYVIAKTRQRSNMVQGWPVYQVFLSVLRFTYRLWGRRNPKPIQNQRVQL